MSFIDRFDSIVCILFHSKYLLEKSGNPEWEIHIKWKHWAHKTQDVEKHPQKIPQKTKQTSNTETHHKNRVLLFTNVRCSVTNNLF